MTQYMTKENSLWLLDRFLAAAKITIRICPYIIFLIVSAIVVLYVIKTLLMEQPPSLLSFWKLHVLLICFLFMGFRYDIVFVCNLIIRRKKIHHDKEVIEKAQEVYNQIRKMCIWNLYPAKLPSSIWKHDK